MTGRSIAENPCFSIGSQAICWPVGHGGLVFSHQAKHHGEPNPISMLPVHSVASIQPVARLAPRVRRAWLGAGSLRLPAVCFQKSQTTSIWALRVSRSISSTDINTHEAAMRTKTPSIHQGWSSISPGRHVLLNQGSNGP